jgi:hypothetical protein
MLAVAAALALAACGARTGLGVRDAAPGDAGTDTGTDVGVDMGTDAGPPECTRDVDCDDHQACSEERCVDQHCVRTPHDERCGDGLWCHGTAHCAVFTGCSVTPVACDDGVDCTIDGCSDAQMMCTHDPDVTRCPLSYRCDPVRGCIARTLAHDGLELYEVDLPDGMLRTIGSLPAPLTDIALAHDGTLYGATPGEMDRIDYVHDMATRVAAVPGHFVALDVAPDGRIYGGSDARIDLIDPVRGTSTPVATLPAGLGISGDLAFVEGTLYATANRSARSFDVLVRVPLDGSPSVEMGSVGALCVWGLAPFGPTLYGLTCGGDLIQIDTATGAGTLLAHVGPRFDGAAAR